MTFHTLTFIVVSEEHKSSTILIYTKKFGTVFEIALYPISTPSDQRSLLRTQVYNTVANSSLPFPLLTLLSHLTLCYTALHLLSPPVLQYTILHRIREYLLGTKGHRSTTRLSTSLVDQKVQSRQKRRERELQSHHHRPDIVAPH